MPEPPRLSTANEAIRNKFLELEARHHREFQDILVGVGKEQAGEEPAGAAGDDAAGAEAGVAPPEGVAPPSELVEYENEAAASTASGGWAAKCTSAVAGVQILVGNDSNYYLMNVSPDVVNLPMLTHLGGMGGGAFHPRGDATDGVVPYSFGLGVLTSAFPLRVPL